jgi:hypothetical protein
MTTTQTPAELAAIIHSTNYYDPASITEIRAHIPSDFDSLAQFLDEDIRDLLHNGNLEEIYPNTESLSDDEYCAICDRILDNAANIATALAAML